MYTEHFGLERLPFELTPNPKFYCNLTHHDMALNTILASLRNGEGFIKITGEVGTGKTLLCHQLLASLNRDEYKIIYVPNPFYTPNELRIAIAEDIGLKLTGDITPHQLEKRLLRQMDHIMGEEGKRLVLIFDEAQLIPDDTLEVIRLLTNLKKEADKNLQIVMFGQPELDRRLKEPHLRQLMQRIAFSYELPTLNVKEQQEYVSQRLIKAGYKRHSMFTRPAQYMLQRASGGIPRVINVLAHKAMLAAYARGKEKVTTKAMMDAIQESKDVTYPHKKRHWPYYAGLTAAVLGAIGGMLYFL